MFVFSNKIYLCLTIFPKFKAEIWRKVASNCIFLKEGFEWFEIWQKIGTWLDSKKRGPKHQQILAVAIVKWSFVPSLGQRWRRKFFRYSFAKNIGKTVKLRKSCNRKQNINRIYYEKLHYNCLQKLQTLKLKTLDLRNLWDSGERKWKAGTRALYPIFSLKIWCYSYLVENSQKATLKFYFESRFFVRPSKFQIYFAEDCTFPFFHWGPNLVLKASQVWPRTFFRKIKQISAKIWLSLIKT